MLVLFLVLPKLKNPITLAKLVMDKSVHVMLSGKGAEVFAKEQGLSLVDNEYFNTEFRYNALIKAKKKLANKKF